MSEAFRLKRDLDPLAILTFIVGAIIAAIQIQAFYRGADIKIYPPDVVAFIVEEYSENRFYLRVAARMAYVNHGSAGYNATVSAEEVEFAFDKGESYSQRWHSERLIFAEGKELKNTYLKEAGPFPVVGGSSVSREMYFAPFPEQCPDGTSSCEEYFRNFISGSEALILFSRAQTIKLTFKADLIGQKPPFTETTCYINVDDQAMRSLADPERRWTSMSCSKSQELNETEYSPNLS